MRFAIARVLGVLADNSVALARKATGPIEDILPKKRDAEICYSANFPKGIAAKLADWIRKTCV